MSNLKNKVAIITGGASGIGRAIAEALLEEEVNVVISSRRTSLLDDTVQEFNKRFAATCVAVPADVRVKSDLTKLVDATLTKFGQIDYLINNAGLGVTDRIIDCSEENWDRVLDTCTKGTFLLSQAVLPAMQAQKSGFIINIASQASKNGYAEAGPYCAAKFGVLGFGLALQEEVRDFGIKVHSLCPGLVQVPAASVKEDEMSGWLQPEDLAQSVLFLLKQPKRVHFDNIGMWGIPT